MTDEATDKGEKERYIAMPRWNTEPALFAQFLQEAEQDSGVSVERLVGQKDSPSRAVLHMSKDAVERLQSRFESSVIIELDQPLQF